MATRLIKKMVEELACELTPDEQDDRSQQLAGVLETMQETAARHEDTKATMKSEIKALEAKRDKLGMVVRRRKENREVAVEVLADDARGEASYVRMDTGEVYHTRPMHQSERQTELLPGGVA